MSNSANAQDFSRMSSREVVSPQSVTVLKYYFYIQWRSRTVHTELVAVDNTNDHYIVSVSDGNKSAASIELYRLGTVCDAILAASLASNDHPMDETIAGWLGRRSCYRCCWVDLNKGCRRPNKRADCCEEQTQRRLE